MDKKGFFTLIGIIFIGLGFLSMILSLIGVRFTFLAFLENYGRLASLLFKIFLVMGGIIMIALVQDNFAGEEINEEWVMSN